jgi:hypothetical protein
LCRSPRVASFSAPRSGTREPVGRSFAPACIAPAPSADLGDLGADLRPRPNRGERMSRSPSRARRGANHRAVLATLDAVLASAFCLTSTSPAAAAVPVEDIGCRWSSGPPMASSAPRTPTPACGTRSAVAWSSAAGRRGPIGPGTEGPAVAAQQPPGQLGVPRRGLPPLRRKAEPPHDPVP